MLPRKGAGPDGGGGTVKNNKKTYKLTSACFQPDSNRDQPRGLNLAGHVGFDSLPDQLVNKSVASGFCFNILCVGKYIFIVTSGAAWC